MGQIQLHYGWFRIVDDFVLFINPEYNLIVMNLETKEQKDLNISKCHDIYSFEDNVLIKIYENGKYTYKLFKFKESELLLLDEKTGLEYYTGFGNLGILKNGN